MYYLVHALLEIQMNSTYLMLIIKQAELRNLLIKTLPKSLFFYHSEEKHFFSSWNKKRFWSAVLINIAHSLVYLQSISSLCVKQRGPLHPEVSALDPQALTPQLPLSKFISEMNVAKRLSSILGLRTKLSFSTDGLYFLEAMRMVCNHIIQ